MGKIGKLHHEKPARTCFDSFWIFILVSMPKYVFETMRGIVLEIVCLTFTVVDKKHGKPPFYVRQIKSNLGTNQDFFWSTAFLRASWAAYASFLEKIIRNMKQKRKRHSRFIDQSISLSLSISFWTCYTLIAPRILASNSVRPFSLIQFRCGAETNLRQTVICG